MHPGSGLATHSVEPLPEQSSTRLATSLAPLATPKVAPPARPVQRELVAAQRRPWRRLAPTSHVGAVTVTARAKALSALAVAHTRDPKGRSASPVIAVLSVIHHVLQHRGAPAELAVRDADSYGKPTRVSARLLQRWRRRPIARLMINDSTNTHPYRMHVSNACERRRCQARAATHVSMMWMVTPSPVEE